MGFSAWLLPAINAGAASLLLNSGIAKTISPGPPLRALAEVSPALEKYLGKVALRGVGVAEIAVAAALLLAPLRLPAAIAALALGAGFALLGLLGILRGSKAPCGCFGASSRRPLGWANVLLGIVVACAGPANIVGTATARYSEIALIAAAIGAVALCVYMRRELIVQFLWPRRTLPAESEAH
jgi:hypothetical protein